MKSTCLRPLKGHPKPTGEKCQLPAREIPKEVEDEVNLKPTSTQRSKESRKRLNADDIDKNRKKHKIRMTNYRKQKRNASEYIGWCDPNIEEKPSVDPLVLPMMVEICIDWILPNFSRLQIS